MANFLDQQYHESAYDYVYSIVFFSEHSYHQCCQLQLMKLVSCTLPHCSVMWYSFQQGTQTSVPYMNYRPIVLVILKLYILLKLGYKKYLAIF